MPHSGKVAFVELVPSGLLDKAILAATRTCEPLILSSTKAIATCLLLVAHVDDLTWHAIVAGVPSGTVCVRISTVLQSDAPAPNVTEGGALVLHLIPAFHQLDVDQWELLIKKVLGLITERKWVQGQSDELVAELEAGKLAQFFLREVTPFATALLFMCEAYDLVPPKYADMVVKPSWWIEPFRKTLKCATGRQAVEKMKAVLAGEWALGHATSDLTFVFKLLDAMVKEDPRVQRRVVLGARNALRKVCR